MSTLSSSESVNPRPKSRAPESLNAGLFGDRRAWHTRLISWLGRIISPRDSTGPELPFPARPAHEQASSYTHPEELTGDALALELGRQWEDVRYVKKWNHWYFFDGSTWREDQILRHEKEIRDFLREKARVTNNKKLRSKRQMEEVLGLVKSNDTQAATVDQWDRDPFLLGVPDGGKDNDR